MSARRGRPKELDGRVLRISISLGRGHARELLELSRESGTNKSGAVRLLLEQSAARRASRG